MPPLKVPIVNSAVGHVINADTYLTGTSALILDRQLVCRRSVCCERNGKSATIQVVRVDIRHGSTRSDSRSRCTACVV